jgi:hypothetical protein
MAVSVGFAQREAELSEQVWWIGMVRLSSGGQYSRPRIYRH